MAPEELTSRIAPLYSTFINLAALTDNERPLHLAHYTSLDVLEKIMQTNEIWFSNPLFMNDHQEMRFVLFEALKVIAELQNNEDALSLAGGVQNFTKISSAFHNAFQNFDINHALDVYVFCLSKYDAVNQRMACCRCGEDTAQTEKAQRWFLIPALLRWYRNRRF
jgi:hypothetical protein